MMATEIKIPINPNPPQPAAAAPAGLPIGVTLGQLWTSLLRHAANLTGRQVRSSAVPAPSLRSLVEPSTTAIITSEVQNGVVGEASALPALAQAAGPMIKHLGSLCEAGRRAGVQVIHATASRRSDGAGSNNNARLFLAVRKSPVALLPGSHESDVVKELGPEPSDLVLGRLHGLNPMAGTDLDPILRNLGIKTVIVTGVSVNVAVTNLVMDAVNNGYQVVLPRDAVCGIPAEYAEAVIDNTLALLATLTTVDELIEAWAPTAQPEPAGHGAETDGNSNV